VYEREAAQYSIVRQKDKLQLDAPPPLYTSTELRLLPWWLVVAFYYTVLSSLVVDRRSAAWTSPAALLG